MKKGFTQRHLYLAAILFALICTFMTALGSAISQIIGLEDNMVYIVMTAAVMISALAGLIIMKLSGVPFAEYGFRKSPKGSIRKVGMYIPLVAIELIPIVIYGFDSEIEAVRYILLLLFTIGVGFNEEIFFRGLIFKTLSEKGMKQAIILSSVIFGILHLANTFGGADLLYTALQIGFAFLVGFVLAEIVCITKSLWTVIIWHVLHDFIAYTTSDVLDRTALIMLLIQVIILLLYAVGMWKRICVSTGGMSENKE